jgi:hypothetical protein
MSQNHSYGKGKLRLDFSHKWEILKPYISGRFLDQVKSVWVIIAYLIIFQIIILDLPIVYSLMIGSGVLIVILGLMVFMEGLMLGLMPFGETIGAKLPVKSSLPTILTFAFLLGMGATFAEPAIAVLKHAGSSVQPELSPLLYSLLNEFSGQLVLAVAIGVGAAVLLGVLRFLYGWSLKMYIIPIIIILIALTIWTHFDEVLKPIIGLAWDCGAVTTGPVTVPLVLALGIGVCRVVNAKDSGSAGFGIVTLASILPVFAVFLLGLYHFYAEDYYGAANAKSYVKQEKLQSIDKTEIIDSSHFGEFSQKELEEFKSSGTISGNFVVTYESDNVALEGGKILLKNPTVIYKKEIKNTVSTANIKAWDNGVSILKKVLESILAAIQAIIPLCIFLFIMLRYVLKEKINYADEILLGIFFAMIGMAIFGLGISIGLIPLGTQLGSNIPSAFTRIQPWGLEGFQGPLYGTGMSGKFVAILFGFFLGYGATLAEPALNALGVTVEKITVGSFKKSLLMHTVAIGVGLGIALGVFQLVNNLQLSFFLIPLYFIAIILTLSSSEVFVNLGWDSAGVTTGPITVPLVLAMGLGIGSNIEGVVDGFGILALASVTPIIAVLFVGKMVVKSNQTEAN